MALNHPSALLVQRAQIRWKDALALLLEAWETAAYYDKDVWSYALKLEVLRDVGLNDVDLCELVDQGALVSLVEITCPKDCERRFQHVQSNAFFAQSCFVLSGELGVDLARRLSGRDRGSDPVRVETLTELLWPRWEEQTVTVWLGELRLHQYTRTPPKQKFLLNALQEKNWKNFLENPFPETDEATAAKQLENTVTNINRSLPDTGLRFHCEEGKQFVRWEWKNAG